MSIWLAFATMAVMELINLKLARIWIWNGVLPLLTIVLFCIGMTQLTAGRSIVAYIWLTILGISVALVVFFVLWVGRSLLRSVLRTWHENGYGLVNKTIMVILVGSLGLGIMCGMVYGLGYLSWLRPILTLGLLVAAYFAFWWFAFSIGFVLYLQMQQVNLSTTYLLVLGAKLDHGQAVSSTLRTRINTSLRFAQQHKIEPLFVMSGGQGSDERRPEAIVMRQYVVDKGYPSQMILVETESTSTWENMVNSKRLLLERKIALEPGAFVTSDYHLYRAAMLAQKAGMPTRGIAGRTDPAYFWQAYMREYFAIMYHAMHGHLLCIVLLLLIGSAFVF
ncbi:YdcF family protein [Weissella minor]|uniref:YdcF family protein n=1 Tax=Weissella minor TaxID=1620 RepID=UPI001BAF4A4C|nr:YdcF family protein [Weissella minor]MBS0949402.1 YdcF family protein [Weissella minor]